MCTIHSLGIYIYFQESYSCSVDWPTRCYVCGWPHSCSLFSFVLHDMTGPDCISAINGIYLCCTWQRPMTRCGQSRRGSLQLRPKMRTSVMRSPCLMSQRTVPSSTLRWPTICTLRIMLRNGEIGDYVLSFHVRVRK